MKVTEDAVKVLQKRGVYDSKYVFLALDEGSNKFSTLGGSCTIGSKYQLVLSGKRDRDYSHKISNEVGLKLTTGKEELIYLGESLKLDAKNSVLILSDNSGILDPTVTVKEAVNSSEPEIDPSLAGGAC